jgi:hypothetical protein
MLYQGDDQMKFALSSASIAVILYAVAVSWVQLSTDATLRSHIAMRKQTDAALSTGVLRPNVGVSYTRHDFTS